MYITWSSFLSLRPSQAAMATTDEAELAAALTLVVAEVANSMAVKVEKEEINGSVIVTKNSKYKMLFVVRQNRRRGRKTSTMSLLIFRFLHDSDSPIHWLSCKLSVCFFRQEFQLVVHDMVTLPLVFLFGQSFLVDTDHNTESEIGFKYIRRLFFSSSPVACQRRQILGGRG